MSALGERTQAWLTEGGPCPCWWTGGTGHGGHCCFTDPYPDSPPYCHDLPADLDCPANDALRGTT